MLNRIRCWWSNLLNNNKAVDSTVKEVKTQTRKMDKRRVRVNNRSQYCYYERRGYFKTKKALNTATMNVEDISKPRKVKGH